MPSHILRYGCQIVHHALHGTSEPGPLLRVLSRYPHGTRVGLALAAHDASHGHEDGSGESELLRSEHRGHDHVAAGLYLSVHLQPDASPEAVGDQCLLRLRQPELPRETRVPHGGHGRRSGASVRSRDQDSIRTGLGDSRCDGPHSRFGYQLDAYPCGRVDAPQVEDQLLQILYGIDVMMRGRGYEGHPRKGMTCGGDDPVHLESHELPSLSRLRSLCAFDLQFVGVDQILGVHAEPSRRHLSHCGTDVASVYGQVPLGTLASLSAVALGMQSVGGLRRGLMGLLAYRSEGHRLYHEPLHYLGSWFHVVHRDGTALRTVHQVADEEQPVAQIGPLRECGIDVGILHGRMQQLHRLRRPGMPLPVGAVGVLTYVRQVRALSVARYDVGGDLLQRDPSQIGNGTRKVHLAHVLV